MSGVRRISLPEIVVMAFDLPGAAIAAARAGRDVSGRLEMPDLAHRTGDANLEKLLSLRCVTGRPSLPSLQRVCEDPQKPPFRPPPFPRQELSINLRPIRES